LSLLYADETLKAPNARALAIRAGVRLIDLGEVARGGARWARETTGSARHTPNFSNGTAGIAYFLATLYKVTREPRFLDAAVAGARHLLAIAKTEGDICLVPRDQPDTIELFYLGWCHGPVGTARLFYQLSVVTGDETWMTWVKKAANGILKSGIPQSRTTGFWNNVGQCCGNAGVAQFFLDLYGVTKEQRYLDFAKRMTADLLSRSTYDSRGTRWAHAEDRTAPDTRVAQTGLMQGAAGIGLWLLRLDGSQNNRPPFVRLPDSPWP
jgi:lantibiotic modifying enzyme